jgi:hypothetical protein
VALTTRFLFSRWSGFVPPAMSLAALAVVAVALTVGVTEQADEGAFARSWQILVAGQAPIVAWFAVRWLPLAPRPGLVVLCTQLCAGVAALAPVFALHL